MINSICLVRLSALGDVLMFVPLVRTLQKYFPQTKLTWIISEPAYSLVKGIEDIEFIVINKPKHLRDYWQIKQQLKHRQFDVLLAAQASFRANLLYPCIRAKRKIGYDSLRAKDGHRWFVHEQILPGNDHTLEGFLKFSYALGIDEPVIRWDLPIEEPATRWAELTFPKGAFLVINPAASKPERSWDTTNYIEVIRFVKKQYGWPVVLTGGPSEYDQAIGQNIEKEVEVLNWIGQTKPQQLLALIKRAALVLCPDTGPSHMAAAMGTPVIALHAVTHVGVSGPYPFLKYAINRYPDAVEQVFGQSIDSTPWGTHVHGDTAMKLITVSEVIDRIKMIQNDFNINE